MNEGQLDIIEIRIIRDVGRCKFHGRFWQHSDSKMMDRQDTETVRFTLFFSFNFSARANLTIRRRIELFFPGHWRMLPDAEISRRKTETSGIVSRSETLPKMQSTTIRDTARFGKETREKNERSSATLSLLPLPSWNCEVLDGKDKVTNFCLIIQLFFNEKKIRTNYFPPRQLFQKYGRRFERVREFIDKSNGSNVQEASEQHSVA